MAWDKKDRTGDNVTNYIKDTNSVSRPMAVVLTALIFVIAATVAFTIFWAGRWTYNKIAGNDSGNKITETSSSSTQRQPVEPANGQNKATGNEASQSGSQATSSSGSSEANSGSNSASRTTSTTSSDTSQSPNTGPTATEIPNTGPQPE